MLERLIRGWREIEIPGSSDPVEYSTQCICAFISLTDFLMDSERFPNSHVNRVVAEMRFLVSRERIPLVTGGWNVAELCFAVAERQGRKMPILIVPKDYLAKIREDPLWQLGMVTVKASLIRDYFSGMIPDPSETSDEVRLLTGAFCAETLLTLEKMVEEEGINYQANDLARKVLNDFPQGLKSLPRGLYQPYLNCFISGEPNG